MAGFAPPSPPAYWPAPPPSVVWTIGSIIPATATAVQQWAAEILERERNTVILTGAGVATVASEVGTLVMYDAAAVLAAGAGTAQEVNWITGWLGDVLYTIGSWIWGKLEWLWSVMKDLAEAIHLKTIMRVHEIMLIVNPWYRNVMKRVYAALGEASHALGFVPEFLVLAIRNTRNLVLDFSTSIGHKYDLAEVAWLKSLDNFLSHMSTKMKQYEKNPEELFHDLAQLLEKPAMDGKGGFLSTMWTSVEELLDRAVKAGQDIQQVTRDFQRLLLDLPGFIRQYLPPELLEAVAAASHVITSDILPKLTELDRTIEAARKREEDLRKKLTEAAAKILSPVETIRKLPEATLPEQQEVFDALAKIQEPRYAQAVLDLSRAMTGLHAELDQALKLPVPEVPAPSILRLEPVTPAVAPLAPGVSRRGWSVGDY